MPGSIRLGRLSGIDIFAHISWVIILVLFTWSLANNWFPQFFAGWTAEIYWLVALISTLLLFGSVLLHELAHALVARAYGLKVKGITLFIFGGVAEIDQEQKRPLVELQIALVGPATSFLLAGVAFIMALPLSANPTPTLAVLDYLAVSNLVLGAFNLIPGFPLDGGRILRAIIWKVSGSFQRATRVASVIGQLSGYVFILLGIVTFFRGDLLNGLWVAFIGWFLLSAARTARLEAVMQTALHDVSVGRVMNPHPITVPANISLQKLVDDYFLPLSLRAAPVMQGEYLSGLITLTDINRVERARWSNTPVGYVMRLPEQMYIASPEQPLQEVLREIVQRDINQVPVTSNGQLVGLLTRESIVRYLQVQQILQQGKQPEQSVGV